MQSSQEPIRTCVACRKATKKSDLLRFVRSLDGEICFDVLGKLNFRGVFVCPKVSCLKKGLVRKQVFKGETNLPVNFEELLSVVEKTLKEKIIGSFGLLRRQGLCESGADAVKRAIKSGRAKTVVLAKDFSENSRAKIFDPKVPEEFLGKIETPFSKIELGRSLGRKETGVVAIMQSRISDSVTQKLKSLSAIKKSF